MGNLVDPVGVGIEGHVLIRGYDDDSSEPIILLNKRNAVHGEHASVLIARALANRSEGGSIHSMHFGTGGATIDPLGNIVYSTPNTTGSADLNTPVYYEIVDNEAGAPSGNQMTVRHVNGTLFADIEIRCVLDKNEPFGQETFDSGGLNSTSEPVFAFDELGLKTEDGLLITHIVFSPVQKSANRIIEVVYTLRITVNA